MKLQLASDLHLEHLILRLPWERLIAPAADADLLVLAGDISNGLRAIRLFGDWPVPVLYVPGNHEFYGRDLPRLRVELAAAARGTSVVVLDNAVAAHAELSAFEHWASTRQVELERVRFLGSTLWTDYLYRCGLTRQQVIERCERAVADHNHIQVDHEFFSGQHALAIHEEARAWLETELDKPFDGKTVVITHHGPHPLSVHPRWLHPRTLPLNAAFVSDLTPLLGKADLWLHGHVHDSFDYTVGGCRVVANPRGYPGRKDHRLCENELFQPACVLEI